jgi:hypothetical protein
MTKHLISGGQPVEVFEQALRRIAAGEWLEKGALQMNVTVPAGDCKSRDAEGLYFTAQTFGPMAAAAALAQCGQLWAWPAGAA